MKYLLSIISIVLFSITSVFSSYDSAVSIYDGNSNAYIDVKQGHSSFIFKYCQRIGNCKDMGTINIRSMTRFLKSELNKKNQHEANKMHSTGVFNTSMTLTGLVLFVSVLGGDMNGDISQMIRLMAIAPALAGLVCQRDISWIYSDRSLENIAQFGDDLIYAIASCDSSMVSSKYEFSDMLEMIENLIKELSS